MQLAYAQLRLFSETPNEGTKLTIVPFADNLDDSQKFAVTERLGVKQCIFMKESKNQYTNTIVEAIPKIEPSIFDSNAVIASILMQGVRTKTSSVRVALNDHVVTSLFERHSQSTGSVNFFLPKLPTIEPSKVSNAQTAQTLGLDETDIGDMLYGQPSIVSMGTKIHVVPLNSPEALKKIVLQRRGWGEVYGEHDHKILAVAPQNILEPDHHILSAKLIGPQGENWICEPTGDAAAFFAASVLSRQEFMDKDTHFSLYQMDRNGTPNIVNAKLVVKAGQQPKVSVGGNAMIVAQGQIDL